MVRFNLSHSGAAGQRGSPGILLHEDPPGPPSLESRSGPGKTAAAAADERKSDSNTTLGITNGAIFEVVVDVDCM